MKYDFPFKAGDVICRDRIGAPLYVTAVGQDRFLYMTINSARFESVAMKSQYPAKLRKWDPTRFPDKHYAYVMDLTHDKWSKLFGVEINFTARDAQK